MQKSHFFTRILPKYENLCLLFTRLAGLGVGFFQGPALESK